jgi:molybdenum cofactor biosynthesis protein B
VAQHRETAPTSARSFVLTVSDTRTLESDTSGQTIALLLTDHGHVVTRRDVVRDEPAEVVRLIRAEIERDDARVLITTGGTGITSRDSTYEALTSLFEKTIVGFGELFRMLSFSEIGSAAMLTRATAGVVSRRAVFVLPGSEHAVRLAMTRLILPELGHVLRELNR